MDFALSFESGLYLSAALLGLVGGLHCAGMCGPVGAALCGGAQKPAFRWWNVTRLASYASAGALAGGGSQWLLTAGAQWPALRAAWVMLQFAALAVALFMLFAPQTAGWRGLAGQTGWMPVTLGAVALSARTPSAVGAAGLSARTLPAVRAGGLSARTLPAVRAGGLSARWGAFTGLLWAGFPCGLLHAALLMAWMSGSAASGAFVMVLFGSASVAWLLTGAGLLQRLRASGRWSELRIRRATGGLLLASWLLLALGMLPGEGSDCAVQHLRQPG